MGIKKAFSIKNEKARTCLKCDAQIEKENLKDNEIYTCRICGQKHFVDIIELEDAKQPNCPQEKEKAIREALEHFGMVCYN